MLVNLISRASLCLHGRLLMKPIPEAQPKSHALHRTRIENFSGICGPVLLSPILGYSLLVALAPERLDTPDIAIRQPIRDVT